MYVVVKYIPGDGTPYPNPNIDQKTPSGIETRPTRTHTTHLFLRTLMSEV